MSKRQPKYYMVGYSSDNSKPTFSEYTIYDSLKNAMGGLTEYLSDGTFDEDELDNWFVYEIVPVKELSVVIPQQKYKFEWADVGSR